MNTEMEQFPPALVEGLWYNFDEPLVEVPLNRMIRGIPNEGIPIVTRRAMYVGHRPISRLHVWYVVVVGQPDGFEFSVTIQEDRLAQMKFDFAPKKRAAK